jgi:hypothetical protein
MSLKKEWVDILVSCVRILYSILRIKRKLPKNLQREGIWIQIEYRKMRECGQNI